VGAEFLHSYLKPTPTTVYIPNPTWSNHTSVFAKAGFHVQNYSYYNAKTLGLDLEGFKRDIATAPAKSIFLVHACAHNPTGVDPTPAQWKELAWAFKAREHFAFMDFAYQGFASGDVRRDALAIDTFFNAGVDLCVAQSFSKNFGLYGERVGALTLITGSAAESSAVLSNVNLVIRPMYSNPNLFGARVVETILGNADLRNMWLGEVKTMADRIIQMRSALRDGLKNAGSTRDWSHITNQIGMFAYTGLTPEQVDVMTNKHHIYLTRNGRISLAGLNTNNVKYVADAIHDVSK